MENEKARKSSDNCSFANVDSLMNDIRLRVREELKQRGPSQQKFYQGKSSVQSNERNLIFSEDLKFLNQNWRNWQEVQPLVSHRPILGKLILTAKNFVVSTVRKYVLGKYFDHERNYQYHLVRFLNETSQYIDRRDSEILDQALRQLNHDIRLMNERMDKLFELAASERIALAQELESLRANQPR